MFLLTGPVSPQGCGRREMRRSRPGRPAAPPRRPAPAWRPTGCARPTGGRHSRSPGSGCARPGLPARARHSCRRWVREALRESSREPSSTSRKNTAPSASESCRARVSRSVSSIRPPPLVRQAPPASAVSYARGRGDVTCRRRPGPGRPPPLGRRPRPARRSPAPGSRAGERRPGSTPPGCAPGSQPPPPWRPDRLHPGRAG